GRAFGSAGGFGGERPPYGSRRPGGWGGVAGPLRPVRSSRYRLPRSGLRSHEKGEQMTVKIGLVAAVFAVVLALSASAGAAGTGNGTATVKSGVTGASIAGCLAHIPGNVDDADLSEYYTSGCTGHDEPELDPVSSASRSAQNITWRVQLPADGTVPVSKVGFGFWFGGTVKDSNPHKIGQEGFLELQFYPDSMTKNCTSTGGFSVVHAPNTYTACSPVWTLQKKGQGIAEPAAF